MHQSDTFLSLTSVRESDPPGHHRKIVFLYLEPSIVISPREEQISKVLSLS